MPNESLLAINVKIRELIDMLVQVHRESEYGELANHLLNFHMNHVQEPSNGLSEIFSMIARFEATRDSNKPECDDIDESGGEPQDNEAEYLSACYSLKYGREYKNSSLRSTLTAVEHNVVLGLILQIKKDTGGYSEAFLTTMQDTLKFVGFSTPQVWEVMTQHLNPESQRFQSAEIQHILGQDFDTHEYN
jgi:hypothetical protein